MGVPKFLIAEETKATSQHQITIPKPIWESLKLKEGTRFSIFLTDSKEILVRPKNEALELTDEEWNKLVLLAHDRKNISRRFKNTKKAIKYLEKL